MAMTRRRAQLVRVATRGSMLRRGSTVAGVAVQGCAHTAAAPSTVRPAAARSAARAATRSATMAATVARTAAASPSSSGSETWSVTFSGMRPSSRKNTAGRATSIGCPDKNACQVDTPGQSSTSSTSSAATGLVAAYTILSSTSSTCGR